MDAYTRLPAPLRFGIPAVLVLVVLLIAFLTLRSPAPTPAFTTGSVELLGEAKAALQQASPPIEFTVEQSGEDFVLTVSPDDSTAAKEALASANVQDRTSMAKAASCGSAPGMTANQSQRDAYANCKDAANVRQILELNGATKAYVTVSLQKSDQPLESDLIKNVSAQVFLPADRAAAFPARSVANQISLGVGTDIERVSITNVMGPQPQPLFEGTEQDDAAGTTGSGSLSSACEGSATATEVETKKAAVRDCYEQLIGDKLTKILGSSASYSLVVEPVIETDAKVINRVQNTEGATVESNEQKSGGSSATSESTSPSTTETTVQRPAGSIRRMSITVALDSRTVRADQVLAVKQVLGTFVQASRGDPAPVVTRTKFAGDAPTAAAGGDAAATDADAAATAAAGAAGTSDVLVTKTQMPKWATALIAILLVGIATTVLVLWRRSAAIAAERRRLEESFRADQRVLENFAQQNPDDLAADLNALFGQPAAAERTY